MPFVPNLASASFTDQARLGATDLDILRDGHARTGVRSGCGVTAQGSPDNTVAVASGTVEVAGVAVSVSSGNLTMTAANGSNPRKDLITVNSSGTKAYTAGTAAATPVAPAIPASSVVLAEVYVPANDNVINSTQITDKRVILDTPSSGTAATVVPKTADEGITTTVVVQDDNHLFFTAQASTVYFTEWTLFVTDGGGTGNFKWTLTIPSGASIAGTSVDIVTPAAVDFTTVTDRNITLGSGTDAIVLYILVTIAGTGGTVRLQWSQQNSNGTTTVKAGSSLSYFVS